MLPTALLLAVPPGDDDLQRAAATWAVLEGPRRLLAQFLPESVLPDYLDARRGGAVAAHGARAGTALQPPQPVEIWNCHLSDMNWPYTAGAAHKYTYPLLEEVAREEYGIASPAGREFNQLKNYVYARVGQIALYEVLVRDGEAAARRIVRRLVDRR